VVRFISIPREQPRQPHDSYAAARLLPGSHAQAIADCTRRIGLDQLQYVGAKLPTIIGQKP